MDLMKYLIQGIPVDQVLKNDEAFYRATLKLAGSVAASTSTPFNLTISSRGAFLLLFITGKFTTLDDATHDYSECKISFTLKNNNGRVYIPDPVSMETFLTPGRVASGGSAIVSTFAASNQLMFPGMDFATVFRPKDIITANVSNSGTYANSFEMSFHGVWLTKVSA